MNIDENINMKEGGGGGFVLLTPLHPGKARKDSLSIIL